MSREAPRRCGPVGLGSAWGVAVASLLLAASLLSTFDARAQYGAANGEWPAYAGDAGATRYSPLDQISKANVVDLEMAWRWKSPDNDISGASNFSFEATPLMLDGVLYTSTSFSLVAAIDARSGETIWVYDPATYLSTWPPNLGYLNRGLGYWTDGSNRRLFLATGDARLIALDADTGLPVSGFGTNGEVDLRDGIPRLTSGTLYGVTSAPTICGDVVIVGSSIHDIVAYKEGPPGDVRGYDARSGVLLWTFHVIPHAGEPGVETWGNDPVSGVPSWQYTGAANVWAPMSCDTNLGYVYLPTSAPTNNFYGGQRPGDNLFGTSLVCLNAATGQEIWHQQIVHHDIWDYDLPAAPNLIDILVDGQPIPAVAQVTKHGFCFAFDRRNGAPVWPIEERPVPQSSLGHEVTSPTQPFPTKPPPFERQGLTLDDLTDLSPAAHQDAIDIVSQYDYGPLFTPPSTRGTILVPGIGGGANWGGAAVDPETGFLYVPSMAGAPFLIKLAAAAGGNFDYTVNSMRTLLGSSGLPLLKPPWGQITAYDLNRGEIVWQVPNFLPYGLPDISSSLLTRELLFYVSRALPKIQAFDKTTGEPVWEMELPASPTGAPMTYKVGSRQYLVVAVGHAQQTTELIGFSLPANPVPVAGRPWLFFLALAFAGLGVLALRTRWTP